MPRLQVGGASCDFETPQAKFTTVLVVGVTGRVGRVLVRKLLLRGYTVRALVRSADMEVLTGIPRAVEVVAGDVGDADACKRAIKGCNKARAPHPMEAEPGVRSRVGQGCACEL